MKYVIDNNSDKSSYMQLYLQLREDITKFVYKYGDKLPSKRTLSLETGVSVITVEHAYSILCDEGYVESKERSGYYVAYRAKDFVPVSRYEETFKISQLSHNTGNDFPFSVFAKTMRNVISKYGERILIKSPSFGCIELKNAICQYLARGKGIWVEPEQIVIGSGSEYLYSLIVQFLGYDKVYAIENPCYEKICSIYNASGVKIDKLKLGSDGIMTEELKRTKASVLHITPYESFPSGVTASASKRNEYIEWALERGGIIIEDDFGSEFTVLKKYEDTVFSLETSKTVIYVNTFSKTIAPSMRISYMVLPRELSDKFNNKLGFYSCTVPVFEQYVLAEFINNGDFERHINRVRRKLRQEKVSSFLKDRQ